MKNFNKISTILPIFILTVFILTSFALGFHNAEIYEPRHGFDGVGHVFYIEYIYKYKHIPTPNLDWETHQSPLYYLLGAGLMLFTGTSKTAQFMNIFILWGIIGFVSLCLWKVFKKRTQVIIGSMSLAALPMLNIFPAMVTNELLSTLWIISSLVACMYLISGKTKKEFIVSSIWITLSFILGFWTKVSIIIIVPLIIGAYLYVLLKNKIEKKVFFGVLCGMTLLVSLSCMPILTRALTSEGPSNIAMVATQKVQPRSLDFYYRLDWIPKVDMYNTQYYSLWGGAWNSFWTDGHNAITPFVPFHKKAFILWSLGFVLLPISLYGLYTLIRKNRAQGLFINAVGLTMLMFYVYYNIRSSHYSAARLTYEMGIVLPYAFGIASASQNKYLRYLILFLLVIQFTVVVSFFWIQPWWHVTK